MSREADALLGFLRGKAAEFMQSAANDMELPVPEPLFGAPLLGVAAGDDPLWLRCREEYIGAFHWTPLEAFQHAFPDAHGVLAGEICVLVWILPQTAATKRDNRREQTYPAERWARSRILGESKVNVGLRLFLAAELAKKGVQAAAPQILPQWGEHVSERYGYASAWSERHAAYVAGLGTFGLCDGLITPVGKAVRVGSLVVRHALPLSERPYTHHREYCLYFQDGSCAACAKRCPVGSVRAEGRDKPPCRRHLRESCAPHVEHMWHLKGYGCGLCQTGVPCESGIPRRKKAGKRHA
ncbi:MAG: 4Fe-4S ferredoxin [Desulfovibrionaceae bacterium]|nr:4Fe-4S ferredoxin [Desulfovibrionaceae bacterium]